MEKKLLFLVLILASLLAVGAARANATAAWTVKADPALLAATANGATAEFLVVLDAEADLSGAARLSDKTDRGRAVYEALTAVATRTQAPLRALLDARGATYRAYWVTNMLWVRGDRALVQTLAARPEVSNVYANTAQRVALPAPTRAVQRATTEGIEWNVAFVGAPAVWAKGITGQGAVIGGQDTGYDWQHEALKAQYRGWGGRAADHDYSWHDAIHADNPNTSPGNPCGFNAPAPCDDDGHGTHTMGTMVGATATRNLGMAPGARWIGCRNMEQGWGTPATYAECYEWFIAPYPAGGDPFSDGDPSKAPHVINNAWSCPPVEGCAAPEVLQAVVEAVRAAGIVTVHSAGNSGDNCETITAPAAIYDASFTVGATTVVTDDDGNVTGDEIADLSSRGPVTIDGNALRKPDIVAPGVGVTSSFPGDGYATLSGTSMAAPHVAGLVALLVSANPTLAGDVDALEAIITQTALHRTTNQACGDDTPTAVPNNVYGWGRIDALAAYESLDVPERAFHMLLPFAIRN